MPVALVVPPGTNLAGIDPDHANAVAALINGQRVGASATRAPPPSTLGSP